MKNVDAVGNGNPARIWAEFQRRGRATVADVAAACADIKGVDVKALVASYATKWKAAGYLEKEAQ